METLRVLRSRYKKILSGVPTKKELEQFRIDSIIYVSWNPDWEEILWKKIIDNHGRKRNINIYKIEG